jgi:hypothetical protein
MAGGFVIYRFAGPPPPTPDDLCLRDDLRAYPELDGAIPPNPALPFGPDDELRAVFDRHIPGIRWNRDHRSGFVRRDTFQMNILLPGDEEGAAPCISLAIDGYEEAFRVLRAIEAENPDWYATSFGGGWLRDHPLPPRA